MGSEIIVKIDQLFADTLSPDHNVRDKATKELETLARDDYTQFALLTCQQLASAEAEEPIAMAAGLCLKNSLTTSDFVPTEEQISRWMWVEHGIREIIKHGALAGLILPRPAVANTAAQVLAAIAHIELPLGHGVDIIPFLVKSAESGDPVIQRAAMRTIRYLCEGGNPAGLAQYIGELLKAVVEVAQKSASSAEVKVAALNALTSALEYIKPNFESEGQRNYIMQLLCESCQHSSTEVQAAALQCLVRVMQLYYDKMKLYMDRALFPLTITSMNSSEETVSMQAIEFWSTICEEEIEIKETILDAAMSGMQPDQITFQFAELALADVIPVILWLMNKQEEEQDEDDWNVSMAAATCLSLFAQCTGNLVIGLIVPYVETNLQSHDWRAREAAVMAFGSILYGPEETVLAPLIDQALPFIIKMMRDPVVMVKDTVAWTLGRICELMPQCIKPKFHLKDLVSALIGGLNDNPRIINNCCWSIINLAEQFGTASGTGASTNPLSPYVDKLLKTLFDVAKKLSDNPSSRTSVYEAAGAVVQHAANDCVYSVQWATNTTLEKLDACLIKEKELIGGDDRMELEDLESNLLGLLACCIRRQGQQIISLSDSIMIVTTQLLNSKQTSVAEDAFLVVGALISALETEFLQYAESFVPHLNNALQNLEDYRLCLVAVGVIGDLSRALDAQVAQYCPTFMQLLVADLQSSVLHRSVKPAILSIFGDIALAIGDQFLPYLEVVTMVLKQAGSMQADENNIDMIDYVNSLYEGVIEAYIGIVQGLRGSQNVSKFVPYLSTVVNFLSSVTRAPHRPESLDRAVVGLLGDLAETYPEDVRRPFSATWVSQIIREVKSNRHYSQTTKDVARWAKEMVKRASP